jgi:hypothetical protein
MLPVKLPDEIVKDTLDELQWHNKSPDDIRFISIDDNHYPIDSFQDLINSKSKELSEFQSLTLSSYDWLIEFYLDEYNDYVYDFVSFK